MARPVLQSALVVSGRTRTSSTLADLSELNALAVERETFLELSPLQEAVLFSSILHKLCHLHIDVCRNFDVAEPKCLAEMRLNTLSLRFNDVATSLLSVFPSFGGKTLVVSRLQLTLIDADVRPSVSPGLRLQARHLLVTLSGARPSTAPTTAHDVFSLLSGTLTSVHLRIYNTSRLIQPPGVTLASAVTALTIELVFVRPLPAECLPSSDIVTRYLEYFPNISKFTLVFYESMTPIRFGVSRVTEFALQVIETIPLAGVWAFLEASCPSSVTLVSVSCHWQIEGLPDADDLEQTTLCAEALAKALVAADSCTQKMHQMGVKTMPPNFAEAMEAVYERDLPPSMLDGVMSLRLKGTAKCT